MDGVGQQQWRLTVNLREPEVFSTPGSQIRACWGTPLLGPALRHTRPGRPPIPPHPAGQGFGGLTATVKNPHRPNPVPAAPEEEEVSREAPAYPATQAVSIQPSAFSIPRRARLSRHIPRKRASGSEVRGFRPETRIAHVSRFRSQPRPSDRKKNCTS
jgi:hypothetical protein